MLTEPEIYISESLMKQTLRLARSMDTDGAIFALLLELAKIPGV